MYQDNILFRVKNDNTLRKVNKRQKEIVPFLKKQREGKVWFVVVKTKELPASRFNLYRLKDGVTIDTFRGVEDIEVDTEAELKKAKEIKKTEIKKTKKRNQNEDIEFEGHIFLGELNQVDKYQKSRDLALALGLEEGEFFDKEDRPVLVNFEQANTLLKQLGTKLYRCKKQESDLVIAIDNTATIEEIEAIEWTHIE